MTAYPDLVGLSLEEAKRVAELAGYRVRVSARDGQPLLVTADMQPRRINVGVVGEQVVEFRGIG